MMCAMTEKAPWSVRTSRCGCRGVPDGQHLPGCRENATSPAPKCSRCGHHGKTESGRCGICGFPRNGGDARGMGKYAAVGPYTSIEEIERANAQVGYRYFTEIKGTEDARVRDFLEPIYDGRFFIVEDDFVGEPPQYRLEMARDDGGIEGVAGSARYPSRSAAETALVVALTVGPVEVRFDLDPMVAPIVESEADPGHFHWRPYLGELAIGERQSRESAEMLAREITG